MVSSIKRQQYDEADFVGPQSQCVTARPPFDPEEFARTTDSRIRVNASAPPRTLASTAPPPPGLAVYPLDVGAGAGGSDSIPISIAALEVADADFPELTGETVPTLAVDRAELEWFELPPQIHLLLLHVNGSDSVAEICRQAGTELAEGIAVLGELAREGLVIAAPGNPG